MYGALDVGDGLIPGLYCVVVVVVQQTRLKLLAAAAVGQLVGVDTAAAQAAQLHLRG